VCIACASFDAARAATSTFNASHAFSDGGLVPFNAGRPPAGRSAGGCEEDVERAEEARHPGRMHSGSRVLTSAELLTRLAADEDEGVDVDVDGDPLSGRTRHSGS
jgi:hypothetical protein